MKKAITIFGAFTFITSFTVFAFNSSKTPSKNKEGIIELNTSMVRDSLMNVRGNLSSSGVWPLENRP